MRKKILMFAVAGTLLVGMTSCNKEREDKEAIRQTVEVSLKANESYVFVLPKNLRDDPYEIASQASHYAISTLGVNASGDRIYQYTPVSVYTGSDQVVLSNDHERELHKPHPVGPPPLGGPKKGGCKQVEEDHYIITFNIQVEGETTGKATFGLSEK